MNVGNRWRSTAGPKISGFLRQGTFRNMSRSACRMCVIFQQYINGFKEELRNMRVNEKITPTLQWNTGPVDFCGDQTDQERQITNQKHEIYVKYTDCRFNETSETCHLLIFA